MEITFISDTHLKHESLGCLRGDILVHCGDFSGRGSKEEIESFLNWMASLEFNEKILIAGNHDFGFEGEIRLWAQELTSRLGIKYLNDSGITINDTKFWGSPVQPEFYDWAFNRKRGDDIQKHWDLIPSDTDILITHGPPFGILDLCSHGERVGCHNLLKELERICPKIHAFGHIHEGYGKIEINNTTYINASILDENYNLKNDPIVINLE